MNNKLIPILIISVLALASCGATTPAIASEGATASPSAPTRSYDAGNQDMTAEEAKIFAELNEARATGRYCGAKYYPAAAALTWNGYLAAAGSAHNKDMAKNSFFGHNSPSGSNIASRIEAAGYTGWRNAGENLAAGSTLGSVTADWLGSPGHCANLMNPDFKEVGINYLYAPSSQYGTYWAQEFGTR